MRLMVVSSSMRLSSSYSGSSKCIFCMRNSAGPSVAIGAVVFLRQKERRAATSARDDFKDRASACAVLAQIRPYRAVRQSSCKSFCLCGQFGSAQAQIPESPRPNMWARRGRKGCRRFPVSMKARRASAGRHLCRQEGLLFSAESVPRRGMPRFCPG